MTHRTMLTVTLVALLAIGLSVPAAAAMPGNADVDDCQNAEKEPTDGGPPGFVADLVPDFLSDLIGALPVPNFVKSAFGAEPC